MADNFFVTETPSTDVETYKALTAFQQTTTSEGFTAAVKSGFRNNISSMAYDKVSSIGHSIFNNEDMLTPEEANEEFEPAVEFDEPISRFDANIRKQRELFLQEQEAIQNEAGLGGFSRFTGSFIGGMADPLTVAASAATAGLGGYAARSIISAGKYVKTARALKALSSARVGGDIVKELAESAIVAAAIEIPLAENLENVYGEDVGVKEHIFNIATGTAAGVLFRSVGRAFTNAKTKPSSMDQDRSVSVVTRELDESASTGKVPNFDKAMEADRAKVHAEASDPKRINDAAKVLEVEGDSDGVYYSTHTVGADDLSQSQIKYGTSLGEGMYMVSNPALAVAKADHVATKDVVKYRPDTMKLVDLDESLDPEIKFEQFASEELPAVVNKAIKQGSTLKNVLNIVDDLQEAKPELGIQQKVNDFFKEKGFDGYKFREDFFEGEEDLANGIFVFEPTKLQDSAISKHTFDEANTTPAQRNLEIEPRETKTPEQLFNEEKTDFPDDNPAYSDPAWAKLTKETFADETVNAPDTRAIELAEEVNESIEDLASLPDLEETPRLQKILEESRAELSETEKIIKAAIVCGKRNL